MNSNGPKVWSNFIFFYYITLLRFVEGADKSQIIRAHFSFETALALLPRCPAQPSRRCQKWPVLLGNLKWYRFWNVCGAFMHDDTSRCKLIMLYLALLAFATTHQLQTIKGYERADRLVAMSFCSRVSLYRIKKPGKRSWFFYIYSYNRPVPTKQVRSRRAMKKVKFWSNSVRIQRCSCQVLAHNSGLEHCW